MKKIKRIKELRKEQEKLLSRQKELKQLIHSDWIEIEEAAKPKNILKHSLRLDGDKKKNEKTTPWIERLTSGAGLLVRKMIQQVENKIETRMSKKVESVLSGFHTKRK